MTTLTTNQKIAVLQERGDEHCRRCETANVLGLTRDAQRERRAYLRAYNQRDLIRAGYELTVRVCTRDEALAAACAKAGERNQ